MYNQHSSVRGVRVARTFLGFKQKNQKRKRNKKVLLCFARFPCASITTKLRLASSKDSLAG
jgi:hypothetical protein